MDKVKKTIKSSTPAAKSIKKPAESEEKKESTKKTLGPLKQRIQTYASWSRGVLKAKKAKKS